MFTSSSMTVPNRKSLVIPIVLAALILGTLVLIAQIAFASLAQVAPILLLQYYASGALGTTAFSGGLATALLGLVFHYGVSLVVAVVFIVSANQLPLLRRHVILGGVLYAVAVYVVMNFVVLPLSAAPKVPFSGIGLVVGIVNTILFVGLPVAFIARWNANSSH